jgi:transcriptional regulator with XRE-family HTH domain
VRKPVPPPSNVFPPPRLLAAARVLVGLTQRQLAAQAGVDRSLISRYEAGATMLRADSFGLIFAVLKRNGISFVEETDSVAMGVTLLRDRKAFEGQRPKARPGATAKSG